MASVPCLPACVHDVPRTSPVRLRVSRALPMTLRNCSPDTLNCKPMNHCSLPCVRSQSCTRLNSLDRLSRARANSPQNRSGCSRRSMYHAAWSSLTCVSSILRQTSRTSSAHSNSYRQKKPVTVPLSLSLSLHSKSAHSHSKRNISILDLRTAVQLHDAILTKITI